MYFWEVNRFLPANAQRQKNTTRRQSVCTVQEIPAAPTPFQLTVRVEAFLEPAYYAPCQSTFTLISLCYQPDQPKAYHAQPPCWQRSNRSRMVLKAWHRPKPAQVGGPWPCFFCPTYTEDAVCLRHAKRGECCMLGVTFSDQGLNRVGDHGSHVRKPIPGLIGLNFKH